ncbi:MAG: DUF4345 domain-containing protein [Sphingomonadaceae bacterium]|nr:DUF4345 domain-containing protein [Sphingomonadaceae bacterium]
MTARPATEKRLLQIVVAIACLVPLSAGATGIWRGAEWMQHGAVSADLDSHFRYMSGIFLGVGFAFVSCIPRIETKGPRLRMLAGFVVLGGLSRLFSLAQLGWPGIGHQFGLAMELGVTPLLVLWQAGLAKRYGTSTVSTASGSIPG